MNGQDPIGNAILTFARDGKSKDIVVSSDLCEDDIIPVAYLFRSYAEMPKVEQIALSRCSGSILDIGAGSGMHAGYLAGQDEQVACIDVSPGAVEYMTSQGLNARCINFFDLKDEHYDTLLFLMNGIGIAGSLEQLERTLLHAKALLRPGGKIVCDSTDVQYMYEDDEGGMWIDLNTTYYGNFKFQMHHQNHHGNWFDWLYVDFERLSESASRCGFEARKLFEEDNHYLAELTLLA